MRPLNLKSISPLLGLLVASVWSSASRVADCREMLVPNVETESIPTSNVPLPLSKSRFGQKPTFAAYSEPPITRIHWEFTPQQLALGRQKPVQTMSVLSDWISEPIGTELSRCGSSVISKSNPIANDEGVRKPVLPTLPVQTEIVQVNWDIKLTSETGSSMSRKAADFHADKYPIAAWDSETTDKTTVNLIQSDMRRVQQNDVLHSGNASDSTLATSVQRHKFSVPDAQTTAELQSLLHVPEDKPEATYLTELSELLQGESHWLFANSGLLDLAPEEGNSTAGVSYLDDLNSLVDGANPNVSKINSHNTVACQTYTDETPKSMLQNPGNPYTSIAPDRNCSNVGGAGVASLFKSISNVQVNGLSTDPPSRPRNDVAPTAELPRPEDRACQFMDAYAPIYYTTPVRYGASRPIRNAHTFVHRPLYYEDPNLERCGQSNGCLTTTVSTVHFVTAIAFTPYLMGANHPTTCVRSLPDCPTCHSFDCRAYWPGWSWTGAAAQAAAVTGLYYVFVP